LGDAYLSASATEQAQTAIHFLTAQVGADVSCQRRWFLTPPIWFSDWNIVRQNFRTQYKKKVTSAPCADLTEIKMTI